MTSLIKKSLSEQIYQHLKKDIILQKLPCGTKLTIKELETLFNVSSTPVREALTRLSQEGLIEFSTNQGARVYEFSLEDLMEITEICELFDCYALDMAMDSGRHDELVETLKEALEQHELILQQAHTEIGEWYYNNSFHTAFYKFIGNHRIRKLSESYRAQFSMVVVKSSYNESLKDNLAEHQRIFDAVAKKDKKNAILLMKKHFAHGKQRLMELYK